ncbi:MAG: type II toxin-antitoxin system VapC family toxin [Dermatophilaceae bacterium]
MILAFDADVLIYAAVAGHPVGERTRALLDPAAGHQLLGSVMLLPELLAKPLRTGNEAETDILLDIVGRLGLQVVDEFTAGLAATLGARYRLRALDAVHLATAVAAGADRFVTHNHKDFTDAIAEVDCGPP